MIHSAADDGWTVSEGRAPSDWGFALDSSGLQVHVPLPSLNTLFLAVILPLSYLVLANILSQSEIPYCSLLIS